MAISIDISRLLLCHLLGERHRRRWVELPASNAAAQRKKRTADPMRLAYAVDKCQTRWSKIH